jgi:hypothetical protein
MEALKPGRIVGRKAERIIARTKVEFSLVRYRYRKMSSCEADIRNQAMDFAPDQFFDLHPGRRSGDDDAVLVGDHPPQHRDRDRVGLARCMTGLDRDAPVLGYGSQDFLLP